MQCKVLTGLDSTLLSWLCRDVFTVQTARFREELEKATSLKSMIALELDQ